MFLMLSCHMTPTRIYSAVFSDLQSHLPHMPLSESPPQPGTHTLDIRAYRGLRLGELQVWSYPMGQYHMDQEGGAYAAGGAGRGREDPEITGRCQGSGSHRRP